MGRQEVTNPKPCTTKKRSKTDSNGLNKRSRHCGNVVVVLENIQSYVDEIAAKGLLYKPMKRKRGKNRSRKRKTAGGAKNGHCGPVTPSRRLTQLEIDEVGSHDGFLMFRRGNVSWGDFTCRSREIDDEIEMAYFTRSLQSQELPTGPHDDQELGEQDRALSLVDIWHPGGALSKSRPRFHANMVWRSMAKRSSNERLMRLRLRKEPRNTALQSQQSLISMGNLHADVYR